MRTSASQFQLLVMFMELNGDLSKPTEGAQGRASNIRSWAELTDILNSDATGDTKTPEKWRKVWSDLKNNTKKKAARIHRAASDTGGGPVSNLKLNNLEERILNIVRHQAATGIIETSLDQEHIEHAEQRCKEPSTQVSSAESLLEAALEVGDETETSQNSVEDKPIIVPLVTNVPVGGGFTQTHTPSTPPRLLLRGVASPARSRTRTQTQSQWARQAFVNSDSEWRAFQREQHRENVRLRERELQQQQQWLDLSTQLIGLGNRFIDYLERK